MKVTLYKSSLCPRCYLARRSLLQYATKHPELELECVDILVSPGRALREGIRMIPAIHSGNRKLSGIFLDTQQITTFLDEIRLHSTTGQQGQP